MFNQEEKDKIKLAQNCGMCYTGRNEEGELEFMGTEKQWEEFERQQELLDELHENDANILIENQ